MRDKVDKLVASAQPEAKAAPAPFELALIEIDLNHGKLQFTPIVARVEWNGAPDVQRFEVLRYKERGESGWKKGSESMAVLHPSFMSEAARALIQSSEAAGLAKAAFKQAVAQVGQAWWATKHDTAQWWEKERDNTLSAVVAGEAVRKGFRRSEHIAVSSRWPLTIAPSDFSDWAREADGSLRRGPVQVKFLGGRVLPEFGVMADGYNHPLYTGSELEVAMGLAQSTYDLLVGGSKPTLEWHGREGWLKASNGSWPRCQRILGSAILLEPSDRYSSRSLRDDKAVAYALSQSGPEQQWWKEEHHWSRGREEDTQMRWRTLDSRWDTPVFVQAGPEDAALSALAQLAAELQDLGHEHLQEISMEAVRAACADTLRLACGAIEDGEELSAEATTAQAAFARVEAGLRKRAQDADWLVKWQQRCETAGRETVAQIETTPQATARKASKPGP